MSAKYQQIKEEMGQKINSLMENCQVFFAFSDEQFKEEKEKIVLAEGDKIVSIDHGGFMPKSKIDQYKNGLIEIDEWFEKEAAPLRRERIAYELANHEAYYTHDVEDTLDALGEGYTSEEVWQVFYEELSKHEDD